MFSIFFRVKVLEKAQCDLVAVDVDDCCIKSNLKEKVSKKVKLKVEVGRFYEYYLMILRLFIELYRLLD